MRLSTLLALSFGVGLSALAGCTVDTTSEATEDVASDELALTGKGVPECMYVGSKSEGWYWNKKPGSTRKPILIKYDSCADVQVVCGSHGFVRVDNRSLIVEDKWSNKCSNYMEHIPVCSAIGSKSEGWYYQDSGKLINWDQCKAVGITCYAIGTRSESFVRADDGVRIDWTQNCADLLRVAKHGEACGESINYTCEYANFCYGIPQATKGGSGTCQTIGYCQDASDCNRYMPNYAPPAYWACEENQCVRKVHVNGPGEECGGFVGVMCVEGFSCQNEAGEPANFGTCQRIPAAEGEMCGGRANVRCAAGLSCVYAPEAEDGAADMAGTCTKAE